MAFYKTDPGMISALANVLDDFAKKGRPSIHNSISICWIRYKENNPKALSGIGAGWKDSKLLYPASIVKIFYAVATKIWLQKDLILESPELKRALIDMLKDSSNDATGFILDLLSGTTSGPSLTGERWLAWRKQRNLINKWLESLHWEELEGANCCQKTWGDGPYGREKDFYEEGNANRNAISTSGTARMLEALMTDEILPPISSKELKNQLSRSLDQRIRKENPENQIDGFLGGDLPANTQIWSKAGLMSQARHDAAWITAAGTNPMLLVIFSQGRDKAKDESLLPELGRELLKLHMEMSE